MTYDTQQSGIQAVKIQKYSYIDILRGMAILGVVAVHCSQNVRDLNIIVDWIFNYGQTGVQLFFIASAITLCLSSAQRSENSLKFFYIRRFFRIAPLFYLAILFYFLWRVFKEYVKLGVVVIPDQYSIHGVIGTVFFIHGFDPKNFNYVVPGGWSIATEMSFYAVFPILFFIQSKYQSSNFVIFSILVFTMCLLTKNFLIYHVQEVLFERGFVKNFVLTYDFLDASILSQIIIFLIGIVSYQYIYTGHKGSNHKKKITLLAILVMIASCILLNSQSYIRTPFTGLIYVALLGIVFGLLSIRLSMVKEFTGPISNIIIELGKVSFSMYIIHFFIIDIVKFIFDKTIHNFIQIPEIQLILIYPTVLVVTFLISKLTHQHIEKRGVDAGKNLIIKLNGRKSLI
jgi:peptidoglycan/LPS O-acetylase OafA/YrhL